MKNSENLTKLLSDVTKMPGDQKIKVDTSVIRELANSDALNRSAALAGISILAFLADKTPMSLEERKNVDIVIDTMMQVDRGNQESIVSALQNLTKIVGYYTENV